MPARKMDKKTILKTEKARISIKNSLEAQAILQSRSRQNLTDRILSAPRNNWQSVSKEEKSLSYVVKFGVEKQEESFVKRMLSDQPILDMSLAMNGKVSILQSSSNTSIECHGQSVLGSNYKIIKDEKQGAIFLDHGTKTFLHIGKESLRPHRFKEKFTSKTEWGGEKNGILQVVVHIQSPYRFRYEIEVNPDKRYKPFAQESLCSILGCSDVFQEAGVDFRSIAKAGIPVSGKVYFAQPGGEFRLISSFAVENLRLVSTSSKDFSIPKGYEDIRRTEKKKTQGKGKPFGPTMRFSDLKNRLKKPIYQRDDIIFRNPVANDGPMTGQQEMNLKSENLLPSCFDETYGAKIANLVDQALLDDIRFLVNMVSTRLTDFSGSDGSLKFNWLDQMKAAADLLGDNDPGGGLYTLLHDDLPDGEKKGLLDRLAVSSLGQLLLAGDRLASLELDPTLQARVDAVLADVNIQAKDRFDAFTEAEKKQLIDAYVFRGIGTLNLTYPTSTGTQSIFYDLLNVRLDNITFDVNINNSEILSMLAFDADSVHLMLNLPKAGGKAFLSRWPSSTYVAATAVSAIGCFFFPPACTLTAVMVSVGVFLGLDFSFVSLDLNNLAVDAHIRLTPNSAGVLQPVVDLTLDADVDAYYISVMPSATHQILALIYNIVLNKTNLVLSNLEDQLKTKLNSLLQKDLALTYPPSFGPVALTGISSLTSFADMDNGYVEQSLNAGTLGIICPYVTQVEKNIQPRLMDLRTQFKSDFTDPADAFQDVNKNLIRWAAADFSKVARYYMGTVLSQNFINYYVYTLWLRQEFHHTFSTSECAQIYEQLVKVSPTLRSTSFENSKMQAHLWPAVPPRTVFTPKPASEGSFYSTTFFDDLRLCVGFSVKGQKAPSKVEFLFGAQTFTELGFGGIDKGKQKLDLLKINDRAFDIYFDLKGLDVKLIHPEVQSFIVPGMVPSVNFDYSILNGSILQDLLNVVTHISLQNRDSNVIPRDAGDSMYIQRYPLGDKALQMVFQMVPFQGNLYISQGLSGLATAIYKDALDLNALDKFTAMLIREVALP